MARTHLATAKVTRATTSRSPAEPPEDVKPTKEHMDQFCDAVRQKKDWQKKILDEERGLARKWAVEAELVGMDEPLRGNALDAIDELRNEAHRIFIMDHTVADLSERSIEARLTDADVARIDADVRQALQYARGTTYAVRAAELKEEGLGVVVSDDLVPESLHRELVKELDLLAAKEPKDFHPGSYGKVQDLIHPSLYPYIAGVSPLASPEITPPPFDEDTSKFHSQINRAYTDDLLSSYAWIPTNFVVSPDGADVQIESYINGLGTREQYPDLFRVLEKMFLLALPHFEKTMLTSKDYYPRPSDSVTRWEERRYFIMEREGCLIEEEYRAFLAEQAIRTEKQKAEVEKRRAEKEEAIREAGKRKDMVFGKDLDREGVYEGKKMKVIVKAANYILKPGQSYDGSWHMEGMPHERIVASMIYYYDTHPAIEDQGLSIRKFRAEEDDFPSRTSNTHDHFVVYFTRPKASRGDGDDEDEDDDMGDEEEQREDHYPSDWEEEVQSDGTRAPMSTSDLSEFIHMGTVPTTNFDKERKEKGTGRILSFPNWVQHKVELVKNSLDPNEHGPEEVATRKILCFFLVDDSDIFDYFPSICHHGITLNFPLAIDIESPAGEGERRTIRKRQHVLTTSDVPLQKMQCNKPTLYALLGVAARRAAKVKLPVELLEIIWGYSSMGIMGWGEAEEIRRQVMRDRKVEGKPTRWRSTFSLCEH